MQGSDPVVRQQWNNYIREIGQQIADELEIPALPMNDPDYDFYEEGRNRLARAPFNLTGQNLDTTTSDVIENVLHNFNREDTRGPVYSYPTYVAKKGYLFPFDDYFRFNFKQKAATEVKRQHGTGKNRTRKHVSIVPGTPDTITPGGGMSEELLGRKQEPGAVLEWEDLKRMLYEELPQHIAAARNGNWLMEVWRLQRDADAEGKKITLREIADHFNALAADDSDWWPKKGGAWHTGTIDRLDRRVLEIAKTFFEMKGLSFEDLINIKEVKEIFQAKRRD